LATSSTTGSAPAAPLPITSRRQSHGMSSSSESGVCPNRDGVASTGPSSASAGGSDRSRGRGRRSFRPPGSIRRRNVRIASPLV
jgi:hypothetical protein